MRPIAMLYGYNCFRMLLRCALDSFQHWGFVPRRCLRFAWPPPTTDLPWWRSPRYIDDMERPPDPRDKPSSYWIRGPRTRRHIYFYPSDNRAGFTLMLLIGVLGLSALGIGMMHILGSSQVQLDDVILTGIGIVAASIGLYQANRLRNRGQGPP
jgi:hypothetical protein